LEYYGWAGTILRVNLTTGKIMKQMLPKDLAVNFIGGRGFNSKLLYDEVAPDVDPLGPDNKLFFGVGPCAGTIVPSSGRWNATAKSPTTGAYGDGNCGGHWGAELKWAGYDVLILEGKAENPIYLWIDDEDVEIKKAEHLWGLDFWETSDVVKKELGNPEVEVAGIGPAGENLVLTACIMCSYTRAAGKCGMGAVMGSKNIKAIAVRGTKGVRVAKPDELVKVVERGVETLKSVDRWWFENFSKYGTPVFSMMYGHLGALPSYNWREGWFEEYKQLSGEVLLRKYVKKKRSCSGCIFHCSGFYIVDEGIYAGTIGEGIEYEATCGFGSKLGNADLASTCAAKTLCDKYGIDLINCTDTLGWAMECYEEGILTKEDTDGLEMSWGNHESIIEAIRRMAYKEGKFGELLALGSHKAAKKIGKGSERYSITIKGQQMGLVEPRAMWAWGLGFGTSTKGGHHMTAEPNVETFATPEEMERLLGITPKACDRFGWEGKGQLVAWSENMRTVHDSLEMCKYFFRSSPRLYMEFPPNVLTALTGIQWTYEIVLKCGERIYNFEKAFNVKAGLSRKDDYLPERFYKEPYTVGPYKGWVLPKDKYEKMLDEYYEARGWDKKTSFPTREKLERLGLKYIADEIEKVNRPDKVEKGGMAGG